MRCEVKGKLRSFEEAYILVSADSEGEAIRAAKRVCRGNEQDYRNPYNQPVKWRFAGLLEVQEVLSNDLGHGVQVYWRFLTPAKAKRMLGSVGNRGPAWPKELKGVKASR
jgi:hypothetical protein